MPGYFIVLDDGTAPVLDAWWASSLPTRGLQPGGVVTARVQRWTHKA